MRLEIVFMEFTKLLRLKNGTKLLILCYTGVMSLGLNLNVQYQLGNPILTSHHSNWELDTRLSESPSFWQRLNNFLACWEFLYWQQTVVIPKLDALTKKYFGTDFPHINELRKNVSLMFVNQELPISYARPNVPKIIEIGGLHVSKQLTAMSKVFPR